MTLKPWRNRSVILLATFASLIFVFWWKAPISSVANESWSTEPNWVLPMDPPVRLLREYRQPNSDYSAGHRGVDVQAPQGSEVFAPADGTVSFAGAVVDRPVISVSHGEHFVSSVEPACAELPLGTRVLAGQRIGVACAGAAGYKSHCAELNCLHWSLRYDGKYLSLFGKLGFSSPSVLRPLQA